MPFLLTPSDLWGVGSGTSHPHAALLSGEKESKQAYIDYITAAKAAVAADSTKKTTLASFYKACVTSGSCHEVSYDSNYGGTPFLQLDARIGKTISIHDRYNISLFYQAFNITNRANYGSNYDINVNNYKTSFLKPLGFINPSSTVVPRSFTGEFGARFSF